LQEAKMYPLLIESERLLPMTRRRERGRGRSRSLRPALERLESRLTLNGSLHGNAITVRPDLVLSQLAWSTTGQRVDFSYTIRNADLTQPTTVALYWSTNTTFEAGDTLAYSTTTQTAHSQTPYSVHVDSSQLATPPTKSQYLLAVIDPDNTVAESDEPNYPN